MSCTQSLGDHQCVLDGEHLTHQDEHGNQWTFRYDADGYDFIRAEKRAAARTHPRSGWTDTSGMAALRLVLLFVFAVAVFGFVAYVWQSADTPPKYVPSFPSTTAVPQP